VCFAGCASIKQVLLLPCPIKVWGNLWCHVVDKAMHCGLGRWFELRMLSLLRTLANLDEVVGVAQQPSLSSLPTPPTYLAWWPNKRAGKGKWRFRNWQREKG
jgi:hypothetical protein